MTHSAPIKPESGKRLLKLTACALPAHKARMGLKDIWAGAANAGVVLIVGAAALAGCVTVEAPDKPIVIELNINITQDVVYRLAEDATETIEENADIF